MTFQNVLLKRGIRFHHSPSDPYEVAICCPFCVERGESADTRFRLGVNVQTGKAHCFNCRWKSNKSINYILRRLGLQQDTVDSYDQVVDERPPEIIRLPKDFTPLSGKLDSMDQEAYDYVIRRGVTPKQILRKNIGVSYLGRYAYRIIFPVMEGSKLRMIVARDFTGTEKNRKYLNSVGEKYLYNYRKSAESVILCEGIFKSLRLERAITGEEKAVALLGHDITEIQLAQLLKAGCKSALIWPDPDRAGSRGAISIASKLIDANIETSVMMGVVKPADEEPISSLRYKLVTKSGIQKYSWQTQQTLLSL